MLLVRTPSIKHLDCDWLDEMRTTRDTLQDLTELHTLKMRDSSEVPRIYWCLVFLYGESSNPFMAIGYGDIMLPNKLESFLLDNVTIVGRGQVATIAGALEYEAGFIDCGSTLQITANYGSVAGLAS